ncbi:hypothetical protein [Robbsia sp. KACC 23696]|uniref:hypothetical protein n=1 Tax=Robbsia sp. KACC 23696 TaxID=3149231 RepID=UPI00325A93ED
MTDQSQYQPPEASDQNAAVPGRNWQLFSQRLSLANALVAVAMLAIFRSKSQWFLVPGTLSIGMVCGAFLVRAVPTVLKIKTSFVGGAFFLLFNATFTIFGLVLAKGFISDALRLPPEDFPITTTILVFWGVIGIWMVLGGGFLATVGFFLPLPSFVSQIARSVAVFFESEDGRRSSSLAVKARRTASWADRLGYGLFGAFFTAVALSLGGAWLLQLATPSVIRILAFAADYENAPDYPGVGNDRIRLHNNGIVSVATCSDWNVAIQVKAYKPPEGVPPFPTPLVKKQSAQPTQAEPIQTAAPLPAPSDFIEQCRAKDSIWTFAHFFAWVDRLVSHG